MPKAWARFRPTATSAFVANFSAMPTAAGGITTIATAKNLSCLDGPEPSPGKGFRLWHKFTRTIHATNYLAGGQAITDLPACSVLFQLRSGFSSLQNPAQTKED